MQLTLVWWVGLQTRVAMRLFIRNHRGTVELSVRPSATLATVKATYIASGKLVGDPGFIALAHKDTVCMRVARRLRIWSLTHVALFQCILCPGP